MAANTVFSAVTIVFTSAYYNLTKYSTELHQSAGHRVGAVDHNLAIGFSSVWANTCSWV